MSAERPQALTGHWGGAGALTLGLRGLLRAIWGMRLFLPCLVRDGTQEEGARPPRQHDAALVKVLLNKLPASCPRALPCGRAQPKWYEAADLPARPWSQTTDGKSGSRRPTVGAPPDAHLSSRRDATPAGEVEATTLRYGSPDF